MNMKLDRMFNDKALSNLDGPVRLEIGGIGSKGDFVLADNVYLSGFGPLLLSEHAITLLGELLSDVGYFVDTVLISDMSYKLFICERQIDALDQNKSELKRFNDGMVSKISRHELNAEIVRDMHAFRLKHRRSCMFVSDHFVSMVKKHELTGFVFEEIWSSETGGVQLPPVMPPIERVRGEFAKRAKAKRKAFREILARRTIDTTA